MSSQCSLSRLTLPTQSGTDASSPPPLPLCLVKKIKNLTLRKPQREKTSDSAFPFDGYLGQKDVAWRSCLGAPNTFPVGTKSLPSAIFGRVRTGAGLRRWIGPAALQVCLHVLDFIFCAVRPLHPANTRLRREQLLLSVMRSCLSLSEHLTSLSRKKLKRCLSTLLLDSRVLFPLSCCLVQ